MHRIEVPDAWFEEGAHIEVQLPQRVVCARCEGGGCDACGRAGAITLFSSGEEPLCVRVGLPKGSVDGTVVLRIPEGGAPYRPPGGASAKVALDTAPFGGVESSRSTDGRASQRVAGLLAGGKPTSRGAGAHREAEAAPAVAGLLAGKIETASAPAGATPDEGKAAPVSAEPVSAEPVSAEPVSAEHGAAPGFAESEPAGSSEAASPNAEREFGHRGMLYLRVTAAAAASPGVARAYGVQSAAALSMEERRRLIRRSSLLVGGLLLAFLVLLWLSGWL
jgi:hypothetical protein